MVKRKPASKFILSTEAQNNFGRLLDDVATNGTRYVIKRFGAPKAVVISVEEFERLLGSGHEDQQCLRALQESRPVYNLGYAVPDESGREE